MLDDADTGMLALSYEELWQGDGADILAEYLQEERRVVTAATCFLVTVWKR